MRTVTSDFSTTIIVSAGSLCTHGLPAADRLALSDRTGCANPDLWPVRAESQRACRTNWQRVVWSCRLLRGRRLCLRVSADPPGLAVGAQHAGRSSALSAGGLRHRSILRAP